MKFSRAALQKAVNALALTGADVMEVEGGATRVTFSATNHRMWVEKGIEGDGLGLGRGTLPIVPIKQFLDRVAPAEVSLEIDGEAALLKAGGARLKLQTSSDDIRALKPKVGEKELVADGLFVAVEKTAFAASTSISRPAMMGVYLQFKDGKLAAATATDSHVMAHYKIGDADRMEAVLVPAKELNLARRVLESDGLKARLGYGWLMLDDGSSKVGVNLIGEEYPPYERLLEMKGNVEAVVERETWMASLRMLSVAMDDTRRVWLQLAPARALMRTGKENGEAEDSLPIEYDGPELSLCTRVDWLSNALEQIATPKARLILHPKNAPFFVEPVGENHYTCMVAHMRDY